MTYVRVAIDDAHPITLRAVRHSVLSGRPEGRPLPISRIGTA
jgi:hypothetical protein